MSGHEENSMKEAGGCAAGFTGRFFNFNSDAEARLAEALMSVGKFVQGESGCLLGHIKAAVYVEDGKGITLNLIDMDNGVEHHGTMERADEVKFNFMCAVLDVDEYELTHKMLHAIDDSGIDYFIDKESLEGHHDHDHGKCDDPECSCHKEGHPEGECDDPNCCCHHHHHGEECDDPECDCHKHGHDHGECDDPDCDCHKHKHSLASMIDENGHFSHHHHHHEHGEECHCHDHEHEHHHDGECCCGHDHKHEHGEECHCHEHKHEHKDGECCCGHDHEHHHEHKDGECCCGHDHSEPKKEKKKGFFSRLFGKKD